MRALRIVVTRPEPGASATAERLETAGFQAILLPLTEIRGLAPAAPRVQADAIVATSANAVRHAPTEMLALLADKPCFAVGGETASAAKRAGFLKVTPGDGDAAALAQLVIDNTGNGARLAYLTGRVRRDGFERALVRAGRQVEIVETYDTVAIAYPPAALAQKLAAGVDAVLLYSGKAAEALASLPAAERHFGDAVLLGLSERIGSALPQAWRKRFRAAGTPDEAALFRLLAAAFPPTP